MFNVFRLMDGLRKQVTFFSITSHKAQRLNHELGVFDERYSTGDRISEKDAQRYLYQFAKQHIGITLSNAHQHKITISEDEHPELYRTLQLHR